MRLVFLNPWAFALVALAALLVLLHAMQSRRRRAVVPSLIIWKRVAARGLAARARRFRFDLPLVLLASAALALVFASARPEFLRLRSSTAGIAVVIDNGTASLAEHSPGPTRLDFFRDAAVERIGSAEAAVISTSPEAAVVAEAASRGEFVRALTRVQAVEKTGSLDAAVALAISRGAERVIVISGRELAHVPPEVEFVRPRAAGANLAIVRADFSDEAAFIAVKSDARTARTVRARMSAVEPSPETIVAEATLTIPPGGMARAVLRPRAEHAEAYRLAEAVKIALDTHDALPADDAVYAARGLSRPLRVGVLGGPSEALERAFRASGAEVVAVTGGAGWENVDVLAAIGDAPAGLPEGLPLFLVAPQKRWGPVRPGASLVSNARANLTAAPMLRGFPPVSLSVARARPSAIAARHEPLMISEDGATLAALIPGKAATVFLAFRPEDSDWPARASFPVFVHRALNELAPAASACGLEFVRVGSAPSERLQASVRSVSLPGGPELPAGSRALRSGLYRVTGAAEGPRFLAVNLLSEAESDVAIAPQDEAGSITAPAASAKRIAARGLARAAVIAALGLLAAEWVLSELATARSRGSRTP